MLDTSGVTGVELQRRQAIRDRSYVKALRHSADAARERLAQARRSVESVPQAEVCTGD